MNYLAHATLAEPTAEARLGSLLGDFSRGLDLDAFPEDVQFAVLEHRALDAHFDAQREVRACRDLFPEELRRFSGILIDVFFDYALANEWDTLGPAPIGSVTSSLYEGLGTYADRLPPRLASTAPRMIAQDWLTGYGDMRNIGRALSGIASRMKRDVGLETGMVTLEVHEQRFRDLALELFPRLDAWVRERRMRLQSS